MHDGVADELSGSVPCDAPAAVNVDDRRAIDRSIAYLGATTSGIDGLVFEQQNSVFYSLADNIVVQLTLCFPGHGVVDLVDTEIPPDNAHLQASDLKTCLESLAADTFNAVGRRLRRRRVGNDFNGFSALV